MLCVEKKNFHIIKLVLIKKFVLIKQKKKKLKPYPSKKKKKKKNN